MRKLSWLIGLTLLSGCAAAPVPAPCNCQSAIDLLTTQTKTLHRALKDKGNLRQQLTICQEKTP